MVVTPSLLLNCAAWTPSSVGAAAFLSLLWVVMPLSSPLLGGHVSSSFLEGGCMEEGRGREADFSRFLGGAAAPF